MRVDLDCICAMLEMLDITDEIVTFDKLSASLGNYSEKELIYASEQLENAECIEWNPVYADSELVYAEYCLVTIRGHELHQVLSDDKKRAKLITKLGAKAAEISLSVLLEKAIKFLASPT